MFLIFLFFVLYLIPLSVSAVVKDPETSLIFNIIAFIIGSIPVVLVTFASCLAYGLVYGLLAGLFLFLSLFFISKWIRFVIFTIFKESFNKDIEIE